MRRTFASLRKRITRKPLALPYQDRPAATPLRFDSSLHTAAEMTRRAS